MARVCVCICMFLLACVCVSVCVLACVWSCTQTLSHTHRNHPDFDAPAEKMVAAGRVAGTCLHIHTYIHIYVYTYIVYIHRYTRKCTLNNTYIYIHDTIKYVYRCCVYVTDDVCTCMFVMFVRACACMHMYVCMHAHK